MVDSVDFCEVVMERCIFVPLAPSVTPSTVGWRRSATSHPLRNLN